jgi:methionyl-tRNA formyltransferase
MTQIKIGYFGDGPWAHEALDQLTRDPSIHVEFVCARFDRPDQTLRLMSTNAGIDFLMHQRVSSDGFLSLIERYNCDLFVSMSFNQIMRKPLFERPRLGAINCHAGKLPFYRGRNVLNWVLINGEKEFGITVHHIDEGIDTGDILSQRMYPITDQDDYQSLLTRAYSGCAELLYETIKQIQAGAAVRTPQATIAPFGSYCSMRVPGDELIQWNQPSRDVFNFVRAICRPGPTARAVLGALEFKINRVEFLADAPVYKGIPGAVVGVDQTGFLVKTADSYVRVKEWSGVDRVRVGDRLK